MKERLISEAIEPRWSAGAAEAAVVVGEPVLPERFAWRGREFAVAHVLEAWKTLGPEKGGSELYLRRHWYRVRTDGGVEMKLYFERKARTRAQAKRRWWLYSIVEPGDPPAGDLPAGGEVPET